MTRECRQSLAETGGYPRSYWIDRTTNPHLFSFHAMQGELGWQQFLFGIYAASALMLIFDFRTRLAGGMTWLSLVSLLNGNRVMAHGGDHWRLCRYR